MTNGVTSSVARIDAMDKRIKLIVINAAAFYRVSQDAELNYKPKQSRVGWHSVCRFLERPRQPDIALK